MHSDRSLSVSKCVAFELLSRRNNGLGGYALAQLYLELPCSRHANLPLTLKCWGSFVFRDGGCFTCNMSYLCSGWLSFSMGTPRRVFFLVFFPLVRRFRFTIFLYLQHLTILSRILIGCEGSKWLWGLSSHAKIMGEALTNHFLPGVFLLVCLFCLSGDQLAHSHFSLSPGAVHSGSASRDDRGRAFVTNCVWARFPWFHTSYHFKQNFRGLCFRSTAVKREWNGYQR